MKWTRVLKSSSEEAKQHLAHLIYQVSNGGALQYCTNGYADDLLQYAETHDIVEELEEMGCPVDGMEAVEKMLKDLYDHYPTSDCHECGGSGELENEDKEGNVEYELCDICHGDGVIEEAKWAYSDRMEWMDKFDNWFNKLNVKEIDDWEKLK